MGLICDVLLVCLGYLGFCFARFCWHAGSAVLYEKQWEERLNEIERLEREIVLELVKCAASNPGAADILTARETARKLKPSHPDYKVYRRLFDFDLGGEPRDERATPDESTNPQKPPCHDSVADLFTSRESAEFAKPEENKP